MYSKRKTQFVEIEMGYGGDLIWTCVFRELKLSGKRGIAVETPMLSDLLTGCMYRRDRDYTTNTIFCNNPDIGHIKAIPKSRLVRFLDFLFQKIISPAPIRRRYERAVFNASQSQPINLDGTAENHTLVHLDMRIHSYALKKEGRRIIWKEQPFAAAAVADNFNLLIEKPSCFFVFEDNEWNAVDKILAESGVFPKFIVFDPDTNEDYFGSLRSWSPRNWRELVFQARDDLPNFQFVQIGLGKTGVIDGTIDLTQKTSFRQAAMIIARSSLFLGTESGLMHAAAAVDARSIILWGGVTRPEYAGYPDKHEIICKYVSCSPCGNLGHCGFNHTCMTQITVDEVLARIEDVVASET